MRAGACCPPYSASPPRQAHRDGPVLSGHMHAHGWSLRTHAATQQEAHPKTLVHFGHLLEFPLRAVVRPLRSETTEQNVADNFGWEVA